MSNSISDAIFWVAVVSCGIAQLFILRAVFHKPLVQPPFQPLVPATGDESSLEPRSLAATTGGATPAVAASAAAPSVPQPRRASEFVWSLLPAVLLALLFVGAWRTMHRANVTGAPAAVFPDAGQAPQAGAAHGGAPQP